MSTSKAALHRLVLVKETLGDEWLTPERIRIGASSVLNDLLMQYAKTETRALRARGGLLQGMTTEPRTSIVWDYAPAPEATDHIRLTDRYGLFIDGAFRDPPRRRTGAMPADDQPGHRAAARRGRLGGSGRRHARPCDAARAAQPRWAALPDRERAKYLFRIARLIQERARELAVVETLDGGKPLRESRDIDIPLAAAHFFHYAGWADKLRYGVTAREVAPLGVVGQIVPWNFPLLMAAWKLAPALACGNTAVLKPAETTPLTALLLAEICQEAELPDGVVSILTGDGEAGAALVRAPGIDKIAFTGSTAVGREIQAALAGRAGRADARARRQVGQHRLRGRGARSGGGGDRQRHLLQPGPRLLRGVAAAHPGERARRCDRQAVAADGAAARRRPAGQEHRRRRDQLRRAAAAHRDTGRRRRSRRARPPQRRTIACELPEHGYWFAPTLFTDVSPAHRIAVEEIFGPVVSVLSFRTQAEAIEKANNSRYGLAAGIWTDKGAKAFEVAGALRAGVVWQNTYNHFDPTAAFGGYKESGFGREGGPAGLRPYLKVMR